MKWFAFPLILALASIFTRPLSSEEPAAPRAFAFEINGGKQIQFIFPGHSFTVSKPQGWETYRVGGDDPMLPIRLTVAVKDGKKIPCNLQITSIERIAPDAPDAKTKLATDLAGMKQDHPELRFDLAAPAVAAGGKPILRVTLVYGHTKPNEGVAIIEEKRRMMLAHMACFTNADYEKYLPDYLAVIKSYEFVTDAATVLAVDDAAPNKKQAPDKPSPADSGSPTELAGGEAGGHVTPYFNDFWFGVQTPTGWEHQHLQGPRGLMETWVPEGKTWDESPCRMYLNAADKRDHTTPTLDTVISSDYENLKNEGSPKAAMKPLPDLGAGFGKRAVVRKFTGDSYHNTEAVAYVDEATHVAMLVLTCKSESDFNAGYAPFKSLVGSYEMLSEKFNSAMLSRRSLTEASATGGDEIRVHWGDSEVSLRVAADWILDNQSGKADGIEVVSYPKGGSWESGDPAVYINFANKSTSGNETVERLIATDFEQLKKNAPKLATNPAGALKTADGVEARVVEFTGNREACCERVAYVDVGNFFAILTLTAKTPEAYQAAIPAFAQWVAGFRVVQAGVTGTTDKKN